MAFFAPLMALLAKPVAATLIGAGASALSSIAQTRNANKMANQGTDLGKLRREAEANGFNPLTVLRATGGQGFKQNVSMGSGALASASFFNAFAGLGQNIAQAKQQEATLKNTLASTANYTAQTRGLSTAAFGANAVDSTRTKIEIGDITTVPADASDAEVFEQRYGDVASAVYGVGLLTADVLKTLGKGVQNNIDNGGILSSAPGAYGSNRGQMIKDRFDQNSITTTILPSKKRYTTTLTSAF